MQRSSVRRDRLARQLGANLRLWRQVNGLTAAEVAERAGVSRLTLRNLEHDASGRIESLLAVLGALGIVETMVQATDPMRSDAARARLEDRLIARSER